MSAAHLHKRKSETQPAAGSSMHGDSSPPGKKAKETVASQEEIEDLIANTKLHTPESSYENMEDGELEGSDSML